MKVALVWMPPASINFPSPQIGYLKAFVCSHGISVDDYYLNLSFAELIGAESYLYLLEKDKSRLLEYLFSVELFKNEIMPRRYYSGNFCDNSMPRKLLEINVAGWVENVAEKLISCKSGVIGFSCTFNQVLPSLALAKKIKQKKPNTLVIFGGEELFPSFANEIIERCPFVDHIVLGQGEDALLDIVNNKTTTKIINKAQNRMDLNNLVIPNYDTYFNECGNKSGFHTIGKLIPIMGSRGCWWAERNRCSFCGGCGDAEQKYVSRDPVEIMKEIDVLSKRYKSKFINFIDAVESNDFYSDNGLLKLLSRSNKQYVIFHQVRTPKSQGLFKMLNDANVKVIQPGLESLDTNILMLMRKGITANDVLRCLYWSRVYNIEVSWNILVGHPGERIEWVRNIEKIIPKIYHLPPPTRLSYVQFQRRSPIVEAIVRSQKEAFSIKLIPDSRLSYLYPQDWNYQNISYELENPYEMSNELKKAHHDLSLLVSHWCNLWESKSRPQFYVDKAVNKWKIYDTRSRCCKEYYVNGRELEVAKQITFNRDKHDLYEKYSEYETEIGNLIDKDIVTVLDGCLIWLPVFLDEISGEL